MRAETAERDADRALIAAKASVREARAEVKRLEAEAAEEVCTTDAIIQNRCVLTLSRHVSQRSSKAKQLPSASVARCLVVMTTTR
jgi:Tfp pilus assembly protein PilX